MLLSSQVLNFKDMDNCNCLFMSKNERDNDFLFVKLNVCIKNILNKRED